MQKPFMDWLNLESIGDKKNIWQPYPGLSFGFKMKYAKAS
jgi:hypothetical protein